MNVSLTPELEKFVAGKLKSGMYQTASEVVRASLRLLRERDEVRSRQLKQLRGDVALGLKQADRGELSVLNEATLKRIRTRAKRQIAKGSET